MDEIRISASSFAAIKIEDKYLLCLNEASKKRKEEVYTPIGGALEFNDDGRIFLNSINAEFEKKNRDLRFYTGKENLESFVNWFEKGEGRETSCFRELREELVDEGKVIDSLTPRDVFIHRNSEIYRQTRNSNRGKPDIVSYYFFEYYTTRIHNKVQEKLLDSMNNNPFLYLASKEEIGNNITENGVKIGNNVNPLLDM